MPQVQPLSQIIKYGIDQPIYRNQIIKYGTDEPIYTTETDSQTWRTDWWLPGGGAREWDGPGDWG